MANPYELLGANPGEPLADIKKKYRRLALVYHPDRNGGSERAAELFRLIQEAYAWIESHHHLQSRSQELFFPFFKIVALLLGGLGIGFFGLKSIATLDSFDLGCTLGVYLLSCIMVPWSISAYFQTNFFEKLLLIFGAASFTQVLLLSFVYPAHLQLLSDLAFFLSLLALGHWLDTKSSRKVTRTVVIFVVGIFILLSGWYESQWHLEKQLETFSDARDWID